MPLLPVPLVPPPLFVPLPPLAPTGPELPVVADAAPVETAVGDATNVDADRVAASGGVVWVVVGLGCAFKLGGRATAAAVTTAGALPAVLPGAEAATLASPCARPRCPRTNAPAKATNAIPATAAIRIVTTVHRLRRVRWSAGWSPSVAGGADTAGAVSVWLGTAEADTAEVGFELELEPA